jgi:acetolactate synthase-1/2/3 large subunit
VKHHGLPIKLFVLNNGGYLSIKRTQNRYCGGRHAGVDADSGVSFPELENIAKAYGVDYIRIKSNSGAASAITTILATDGPVVCEVMCDPDQEIAPAVTAEQTPDGLVPKPLEDMYPFLDRQVFKKEMIVKPL